MLSAEVRWRNAKFVLKSAVQAGRVVVTYPPGNFFHGEFRLPQKFRRLLQPLIRKEMAQVNAHLVLE